ncbi:hypothetical protein ACLOJK_005471, partial [Asimina triloba]
RHNSGDRLSKVWLLAPLVILFDDIEALATPDRHSYLIAHRIEGHIPGEVEISEEREIGRMREIETMRVGKVEGEIEREREDEGERLGGRQRELRLISDRRRRRSVERARKI